MSIRGKPGNLYTYAKGGGRIPLGSHIQSRREVRQAKWTAVEVEPAVQRAWAAQQRREAAQNLLTLPRPLKPPARRSP